MKGNVFLGQKEKGKSGKKKSLFDETHKMVFNYKIRGH